MKDNQLDMYLPAFKRYLKLLYKMEEIAQGLQNALTFVTLYTQYIYAYEWICKVYYEFYDYTAHSFKNAEIFQKPIEEYAENLLIIKANSNLVLFIKAFGHYNNKHFALARDLFYKVLSIQPNYHVAVKLLANIERYTESFALAEELWLQLGVQFQKENALGLSFSREKEKFLTALYMFKEQHQSDDIGKSLA